MDALAVEFAGHIHNAVSLLADTFHLAPLSSHANAEHIPLTDEPSALYVRRERKDRGRVVNVFDGNGQKSVYH
jgi:hypothetical protein